MSHPCNCCNPSCAPPCSNIPAYEGPDTVGSGDKVKVVDDNGGERALDGAGLLLRRDGAVFHTDGSPREGEIPLSPDIAGGGDNLLVLAAGLLKSLIANGNEGKVLMVQGNKFTLVNPTTSRTTFDPADILQFTDSLAAFGCGPQGTLRLGAFRPTPSTFLYFDETGKIIAIDAASTVTKLLEVLCATTTAIGPSETIEHAFGCTPAGDVRKFLAGSSGILHVRPRHLIFNQNLGPTPFIDISNYFDIRTVPGYHTKYSTALISFHLTGGSGTNSFTLTGFVDGDEYARVQCNQTQVDSVDNQVLVPIPGGKILLVQVLHTLFMPGAWGYTQVTAYCDGFIV